MAPYLVIARKWRPGLFEEIVGQEHVTRTLRNAVSSGRIAHAYLFSGPRGVGKTTAARILAKSLNCVNGPTPAPCNSCDQCKGIAAGSSVDVFEIDGASNNSVESIRELTDGVRYVPGQGKYRVYIIDEVHMLSTSAFNALLKTLEEPPAHAIFIFATTEVHKIPLTILSRCQRFDFKRIPFRDIQSHLRKIVAEEGIRFDEEALYTLAREADGSLRDAQSLLEQVVAFAGGAVTDAHVAEALGLMDRSILFELSEAMLKKDGRACLNLVEKIYDFGYDLKRGLSDLLEHIRDLVVVKVTGDNTLLDLPDSELERLRRLADLSGTERLHMLFSVISKGYEDTARSAQPRYSFEMALLKAAHFDELKSVADLISEIDAVKDRLGPALRAPVGAAAADEKKASAAAREDAVEYVQAPFKRPSPAPLRAPEPKAGAKDAADCTDKGSTQARAPSGAPISAQALVEEIRRKIPGLSEGIQSAAVRIDGDSVEITTASDKAAVFRMKEKQIEGVLQGYFGRRMSLSIAPGALAQSPSAQKEREAEPVVKDALRILGGRIIEDRRRSNV